MHTFLEVAGAVVVTMLAVSGIATVTTGWVMPIGRHRVLRPRLWGYGTLVCAAGAGVFLFLGPLANAYGPLPWAGWIAFMAGLGLQWMGQRPGRVP
ncbi:hypothetical protein ACH4UM_03090 [Streptomyces sp. NPDC020801]|uniref:hypothetical protein n=1 Tax=unclassified Streptomyces TaxID=2593676 RepID=UPI0037A12228